jgi:hypothetical protein
MNKVVKKYRRRVSFLILLSYIFLLGISTTDIHKVDIFSGSPVIEQSSNTGTSDYRYSHENSCPIHFAYSSVNQVIFQSSDIFFVPAENIYFFQSGHESGYSSIHLTGSDLRAPPASA